jgi:hypothetical protein
MLAAAKIEDYSSLVDVPIEEREDWLKIHIILRNSGKGLRQFE